MENPRGKAGAPTKGNLKATGNAETILRSLKEQDGLNGHGILRSVLETARLSAGCGLGDLTVLSAQVDPYRLDTPSGHRDGAWVATQLNRLFGKSKKTHWRDLHYAVAAKGNIKKPDGAIYRNTDEDWNWLGLAAKPARWLGHVPFDRIIDNRNAEPVIHRKARVMARAVISIGLEVEIPDADDLEPAPVALGFEPRQAYQFVIYGEKAGLEDVALPVAQRHQADLYLPTGEISDTLMWRIAKDAAEDGRPLVVFTLTDCDPSGYQMSVSIARKLQALRDLLFPDLKFEVVPVALTVDQVRELGLLPTPLKETEKRADRWRAAFGVEQTEINALYVIRPDDLREILERAFDPYFDRALEARVLQARDDWYRRAREAVDAQVDPEVIEALRTEAADRLGELEDAIASLNDRLNLAADDFDLPPIEVPQAEIDDNAQRHGLVSFDDDWVDATRALIKRKSYGGGS